jgi:poly(A) polymerase/tRNA nucleotidyltransferase (CCA-adding enzyme)
MVKGKINALDIKDCIEWQQGRKILRVRIPEFVGYVLGRLYGKGYTAFIVGGALRDIYMGAEVEDWDIATDADSQTIQYLFSDTRLYHLKHDTVTLVFGRKHCEVTSFRGTAGFGSIEQDLEHRDFTINAMAWEPIQGSILDPCEGLKDIKGRLIKAAGRPEDRFQEDPLRMLRAIRFAAVLQFHLEANTRRAITRMAEEIKRVSQERIRDELVKTLMAPGPSRGLRLMHSSGLMEQILPEVAEGSLKHQNDYHRYTVLRHTLETVDAVAPVLLLRVSALFHDVAKPRVRVKRDGRWIFHGHEEAGAEMAEAIMKRLRFDKALIYRVRNLIRHHLIGYRSDWTDGAVRRLIRRVGEDEVFNLLSLRKADILAHGGSDIEGGRLDELESRIRDLIKERLVIRQGELAIDGKVVMKVTGLEQGPEVGHIMKYLLEKVSDNPSLNSEAALIEILKEDFPEISKKEK